ncbi:MAG: conjugal transfer protein TraH [Propionivibrio sp.]|nr:conjugal transfer protein TraH [Propionivibrio sp.]
MPKSLKHFLRVPRVRNVALATAVAAAGFAHTANAGFLEDFYTSAGASANYTAPQVYQNQAMGVINGGSMVFKAPIRNFTPFTFTPPHLKAGCGGIDVFLGAFGFVNKEQFVQFLKNVGQNAMGLAFKVALHAISPDLEQQIQQVANMINEQTRMLTNSCEAAKALMDAGPGRWIHDAVRGAKDAALAGSSGDAYEANETYRADGYRALRDNPRQNNSGGYATIASDLNITYSAVNSGTLMGISEAERQLMYALLGMTVFKTNSAGDNIESFTYTPKIDSVAQLVGDTTGTVSLPTYSCSMDCLSPVDSTQTQKPFAAMVYERALRIRQNIMNRTMNTADDIRALTVPTSIPMYKIIALTALPNYTGTSDVLLQNYSMAVGWEIASYYIETVATELSRALNNANSSQPGTIQKKEAILDLLARIKDLKAKMVQDRAQVYAQIAKDGAMVTQIEQIQRQLYGSVSASVAANAAFGINSR